MKVVVVFILKFQVWFFLFLSCMELLLFFFLMDDQEEKRASVVFHENFLEVKSFTLIEMLYKIVP